MVSAAERPSVLGWRGCDHLRAFLAGLVA